MRSLLILQMLNQLFGCWFGRKQNQIPPQSKEAPPPLSDADLESLFTQLLLGVDQRRGEEWAHKWLKNIEHRVTTERWVEWLRRFGERLLASPAPKNELAGQLMQLGELGIGEIGDVAYDIGMQLLSRNPGEPIAPADQEEREDSQEAEFEQFNASGELLVEETNRQDAKDAKEEEKEAEAWFNQGNKQYEAGDFEGAIASYDKAIKIKPTLEEGWYNRGLALASLGQYEEAIASFDKATETKPNDYQVWYNRGLALDNLGRYEEAIASYDKAIAIKPNYEAWLNQGVALDNLGRYEDAIASYNQAIQIKPNDHRAWNNRGVVLSNLERYEEAIASYDKAIKIKSGFHQAWFNQGMAQADLGQFQNAIASYDKAVEIKPDDYHAWNNRGMALGYLGQYEEEIASLDKAIAIKPDRQQAWFNRGIAAGSSVSCDTLLASLSPIARQNPHLNLRGYEGVLVSYEEGLKYCQQDTHPEGWGKLHQGIGNAYYFQGRGNSYPRRDWLKAVSSYNQALLTLTQADFPQLHLEVLQDLIRAFSALEKVAEAEELRRCGTDLLQRLLKESNHSEHSKKQLALEFAGFGQLTVDLAVQSGDLVEALELAEQGKNACLSWILDAWSDEVSSPRWEDIKQLLNSTTAAAYWHLSPAALHTFILKHDAPSPILITPSTQTTEELPAAVRRLRDFENWVKDWNQNNTPIITRAIRKLKQKIAGGITCRKCLSN